jgi:deoxyribodipyrimidine photo-lyase
VYSVFTYFWKKWRDRDKPDPVDPPAGADLLDTVEIAADYSLPTLADLGFDQPEADVPPASTAAARELLAGFCEADIYDYDERRDYPADECTSRLSAHLKFGTIGIREVHAAVREARSAAEPGSADAESATEFESQLAWREFYSHVLWNSPEVVTENFKEYERPIEWNHDPEGLQAWKDGETGYPIVDAGMRQLRREAFMHNRVRMIVASFLTKDLLIDWREGYDWFRAKLVDHDTANDNGGWQWAASTGTDAQPYFRVFNPMTQGERYDPDAEYVREYVPELRDVPADAIHAWHELDAGRRELLAPDYPAPVVDHGERREQAIAMFEAARGDD